MSCVNRLQLKGGTKSFCKNLPQQCTSGVKNDSGFPMGGHPKGSPRPKD